MGWRSDFLIQVDKRNRLGEFSYEVVETKLTRSAKARTILQLCFYSELLEKIQGVPPDSMYVVLGGGTAGQELLLQGELDFDPSACTAAERGCGRC